MEALKRNLRPEFLNRIDEIVVFHPLTQEQIVSIVGLMAAEVQERLQERHISFSLTHAASEWLAKEGYDPTFGARPLRRAIQRRVENPLSKGILAGDYAEGDHVEVDIDSTTDQLVFRKQEGSGGSGGLGESSPAPFVLSLLSGVGRRATCASSHVVLGGGWPACNWPGGPRLGYSLMEVLSNHRCPPSTKRPILGRPWTPSKQPRWN